MFFSAGAIERAFMIVADKGHFQIDSVSPAAAAKEITAPVLIIHGAADTDTPPDHSRRIFAALAGPKRLILVPGARHNEALKGAIWSDIERWIDTVLGTAPATSQTS